MSVENERSAVPLIQTSGLSKHYRVAPTRLFERAGTTIALDAVSLSIARGESVAVVGESGSGKSTLLRALLGLSRITSGEVRVGGREVDPKRDDLLWLRRRTGLVFQDPHSSFNPRRTVGQTASEPLVATGVPGDHRMRVEQMFARLELSADAFDRYPHEFSGGQRQRIAIARALVHGPEILLADEPVSALDVLVRGRLLRMLAELRAELGLTLLTVTHDLAVVPRIAERVIVMRSGRIVEDGTAEQILHEPREEYTRRLIAALPKLR